MPSTGKHDTQQPTRTSGSDSDLDEGDRHLLLWMLELTSTERLRVAEGFANDVLKLRNARKV